MKRYIFACLPALLGCIALVSAELPSAQEILNQSGVQTGLAVVLGTSDGSLESELHNDGRILVHGLSTDQNAVTQARSRLLSDKVYGLASVDYVSSLTPLPYYETLINLLVADLDALGEGAPPQSEIMRVLAYNGVAYLKEGGIWSKTVREMPDNVDEFTHYRYDAARSNVSGDGLAGPPNAIRYVARPTSHQGYYGCRVGNGVTLHLSNRGKANKYPDPPDRQIAHPHRVFAKDAFSGIQLWYKDVYITNKTPEIRTIGDQYALLLACETNPRDPIGLEALDMRTGVRIWRKSYDDLTGLSAENIADAKGMMCVLATEGIVVHNCRNYVFARRESDGEELWRRKLAGNVRQIMSADGLVLAQVAGESGYNSKLVALELESGEDVWEKTSNQLMDGAVPGLGTNTYVQLFSIDGYFDGKLPLIFWKDSEGDAVVMMCKLSTGERLWAVRDTLNIGGHLGPDKWETYPYGDHLFAASLTRVRCYRIDNGSPVDEKSWGAFSGGNYNGIRWSNCNTGIATEKFLMVHKLFQPWDSIATLTEGGGGGLKHWPTTYLNRLISHACKGYSTPAYGSIYNDEGTCNCASFLPASTALFARKPVVPVADNTRLDLEYDGTVANESVEVQATAHATTVSLDWKLPDKRMAMCYSGPSDKENGRPRGEGSMEVWGYSITVTDPVVAGDLRIVAHVHEHRIAAERNDTQVWNFIAGGRIGSRGGLQTDGERVYFGCHDGYVYAVNLSDGSLAWRFLAAPDDFRMSAFGQVESSWPVFSVVLDGGSLYCSAGRHQDLDGGIHFYSLDPTNGGIQWHIDYQSGFVMETNKDDDENGSSHAGRTSAINGLLVVQDGELILNPIASFFKFPLENPESWVRNEDDIVPPLIPEDNQVGAGVPRFQGGIKVAFARRELVIESVTPRSISVSARPDADYTVRMYDLKGRTLAWFSGTGSRAFTIEPEKRPGSGYYMVSVSGKGYETVTKSMMVTPLK